MKKRFLAILLTICMVLSMAPAALAAETDPFTDVNSADWYYDEVQYVYENDLMKGTSDTTFSPDTTVSRAMIVTILYRLEGQPTVSTAGTFTDVAAGQYYTEAVEWGYANQIIGGYGSGLFGPSDPLTREQMAAILYRYAQYKEYDVSDSADLSGYTDVGTVSAYALDAFAWANANGLVKGTSATTLSPKGSATRAQFAVILCRFCVNVVADVADADTTEEYTVTFEYNYGSKGTYKTVTVEDGETVKKPANPTRGGYSFSGWYTKATGGEKFDFDTEIIKDTTLYAQWTKTSSNGGGGGSSHSHRYSDEWSHDADKHWNAATCGHDVKKNEAAHTTDADGLCSVCGVYVVSTNEQLEKAVHSVGENIVIYLKGNLSVDVAPWETKAMGGVSTKTITIDGSGLYTLTFDQTDSDWNHVTTKGAKLILKNMNITNSGHNDGPWNRHDINFNCEVELENVNSDKALAFKAGASLTNVAISDANNSDTYAIWIQPNGQTVTLNGCTIDMLECTDGRGIKIDDQYVNVTAQKVTLNVSDTIFKTEEKSAIIVKSPAGADITLSNVDITNVAADSTNAVWVDEDSAASYNLVTVIGGTKILENNADAVAVAGTAVYNSLQEALDAAGAAGAGDTTISIIKDIDLTGDTWTSVNVDGYHGAGVVTVEGGGHTITGLNAPLFAGGFAGDSGIVIKDLTLDKANMTDTSDGKKGFGAFISSIDSMHTIELKNCKLTNSTIYSDTGSRVGGLIGWTAGYDIQDNGPVDTKVTIQNCEVSNCIITAAGSVGAIIGHAGNNPATYHNISDCVVKDNTLTSTDGGDWRVGVVVGTANVGEVTISGTDYSGNTLSQTDKTAPDHSDLYGRFVPGTTGKLTIDGVTMLDNGVSYGYDADKDIYSVSDDASLDYVIGNMDATSITLAAGTYTMPDSAQDKTLTISGTEGTTINVVKAGEGDYGLDGSTVTFEDLALSFDEQDFNGYVRAEATYNNCTIEGRITLYGKSIFNNCTFDNMEGYNVWTWGSDATFNKCTFNCGGKAVLVYGGSTSTVNITNCTFNDKGGFDGKAAIETGSDYDETFNINIENVTVNGFDVNPNGTSTGTTVWANKNSMDKDHLNVVIDDVDVY